MSYLDLLVHYILFEFYFPSISKIRQSCYIYTVPLSIVIDEFFFFPVLLVNTHLFI
jgi:hypothetical protein